DGAVAQLRQDGTGPVVAAVVDDDDLAFDGQLHRPHPAYDLRDGAALVEDRDDDRQRAEPGFRSLVANAALAHALSRTTRRCGRDLRGGRRSEEHTSELQSRGHLVCRLLLEKKKTTEKNNRFRNFNHTVVTSTV